MHGERDPGGFRPRILPPVWAAIAAGAMWLLAAWARERDLAQLPGIEMASGASAALGIAVLVAGVAWSAWAAWGFAAGGTPIEPGRVSTELLVRGPFRVSRNPIYLGMAVSLVGWTIWLAQPLALLGVAAFVLVLRWRIIGHEERMLTDRFGDEYLAYRSRVRRWL
jgi:protein-S-isoprenylcysteine O-methyltransferase Ste14